MFENQLSEKIAREVEQNVMRAAEAGQGPLLWCPQSIVWNNLFAITLGLSGIENTLFHYVKLGDVKTVHQLLDCTKYVYNDNKPDFQNSGTKIIEFDLPHVITTIFVSPSAASHVVLVVLQLFEWLQTIHGFYLELCFLG